MISRYHHLPIAYRKHWRLEPSFVSLNPSAELGTSIDSYSREEKEQISNQVTVTNNEKKEEMKLSISEINSQQTICIWIIRHYLQALEEAGEKKKKKNHTGQIRFLNFLCFIRRSILKHKYDLCSVLMIIHWMLMLKWGLIHSHILLTASAVYVPGQVPVANDPPVIDSP